jgi:hypothetical protein
MSKNKEIIIIYVNLFHFLSANKNKTANRFGPCSSLDIPVYVPVFEGRNRLPSSYLPYIQPKGARSFADT